MSGDALTQTLIGCQVMPRGQSNPNPKPNPDPGIWMYGVYGICEGL